MSLRQRVSCSSARFSERHAFGLVLHNHASMTPDALNERRTAGDLMYLYHEGVIQAASLPAGWSSRQLDRASCLVFAREDPGRLRLALGQPCRVKNEARWRKKTRFVQ